MAQSTLANLETKVSPATIREAKLDGLATGSTVNFSGQYLYDRLIENNEAEQTRMMLVRSAINQVDVAQWKAALKDMVEIAKKHGESKEKTARNTMTVLRNSYGALRFAKDVLEQKYGLTETSGFNVMQIAAPKALKDKGIKWDGTPVPTDEQKADRTRIQDERTVMNEIQKANPIQPGESVADWTKRCLSKYDEAMLNHENVQLQRKIDSTAARIIKDNRDIAGAVSARILEMLQEIEQQEQEARTIVDSTGKPLFVRDDDSVDLVAYLKHKDVMTKQVQQTPETIQRPEGAPVH